MSCKECDENPITGAYYRWRNANIEIVGCRQHVKEVMETLNSIRAGEEEHHEPFKGESFRRGYMTGYREAVEEVTRLIGNL